MNSLICLLTLTLGQVPDYMLLPEAPVVIKPVPKPDPYTTSGWHKIVRLNWYPSVWVWGHLAKDRSIIWDPEAQADAWVKVRKAPPVWRIKDSRGTEWEHYDSRVLYRFIQDQNDKYRNEQGSASTFNWGSGFGGGFGTAACTTSA